MAAKGAERAKTEKNMIDQINGDEDAAPVQTPAKAKTGWMTKGVCGKSSLKRASDFAPLVAELKKAYGYVWIYAAEAAGYDPYDVKKSTPFNTMLRETANEN